MSCPEIRFQAAEQPGYPAVSCCSSLRLGLDVGVLDGAAHGCGRSRESEKLLVVMSFVVIFSESGRSQ